MPGELYRKRQRELEAQTLQVARAEFVWLLACSVLSASPGGSSVDFDGAIRVITPDGICLLFQPAFPIGHYPRYR